MSWAVGYDERHKRDIGYGVPAKCDQPGCDADIDRGLGYVCGGDVYGGEHGCGLFFCSDHMIFTDIDPNDKFSEEAVELCERCQRGEDNFEPSPDVEQWLRHKLNHESWADWRNEDPQRLVNLVATLSAANVSNKPIVIDNLSDDGIMAIQERFPSKETVRTISGTRQVEEPNKPGHYFTKPATYRRELPKIGRNDPCHCGSGKKFKRCCHD